MTSTAPAPKKRADSLDTAKRKGQQAFLDGIPVSACPYRDKRTDRGAVTWSRAYRSAWLAGWHAASRDSAPTAGSTTTR